MKPLLAQLLTRLIVLRDNGAGSVAPALRRTLLIEAFSEVAAQYDGSMATNFKELIEKILEMFQYDIDLIMGYLGSRVYNPYTAASMVDVEEGFDERYGTTTDLAIEQVEMPEEISEQRLKHSGRFIHLPVRVFRIALDKVEQYAVKYNDWNFIDIGSGLGRNLLIASQYPFKKVIGVEISDFLCRRSLENVGQYNKRAEKACVAAIHCCDVLEFEFPANDSILYFWEPVSVVIMKKLLAKIEAHAKKFKVRYILIFAGDPYLDKLPPSTFRLLKEETEPVLTRGDEAKDLLRISYYAN